VCDDREDVGTLGCNRHGKRLGCVIFVLGNDAMGRAARK
jgi:hypothetical protein